MTKSLTFSQASGLYLFSMFLVIVFGFTSQDLYGPLGLIVTELLCILVPALFWLRSARVPFKEGLLLRWPGWKLIWICLVLGVCAWFIGAFLDQIVAMLFGYVPGQPPSALPHDAASSLVLFVGVAITAPIAEEIFFRGALQRAFRKRGVWFGILFTAALFALFHLRFQGLPALVPVSILLGFVVERSRSLLPAIAVHFANNALAAGIGIGVSLRPDIFLSFPLWVCIGFLLSLLAFVVLLLIFVGATRPARQPGISQPAPRPRFTLEAKWPLVIAFIVFAWFANNEFVAGRHPESFSKGLPLEFQTMSLPEPLELEYLILSPLGEPVGEARCRMYEMGVEIGLDCAFNVQEFNATDGFSTWSDSGHAEELQVRWNAEDMRLVHYRADMSAKGWSQTYSADPGVGVFNLDLRYFDDTKKHLELPQGALLSGEWAWRSMALPFELYYARQTTLGLPFAWDQEQEASVPMAKDTVLSITSAVPLHVPAGNYHAWIVEVDDQTAWYALAEPHVLLRWFNEYTIWELKSIN